LVNSATYSQPTFGSLEDAAETTDILFQTHAQLLFNLDGIGEIALSYQGNGAKKDKDDHKTASSGWNGY